MDIVAVVLVLIYILCLLSRGHRCPNCKTRNGVTIEKDDTGEYRKCSCCGHHGYACNYEIKNKDN
jgi:Zn ribbon nucleic-acid-binding protein